MFGMEMLDVLIGLVTLYLVFGLACTAIVEAVAASFSLRSKNLKAGLQELLAGKLSVDQSFVDAFYQHPLVQALSKGSKGRPSYIAPATVSQVVEALLARSGADSLKEAIARLPGTAEENRIKGVLEVLMVEGGGDSARFRQSIESQFNDTMTRAAGWFKRHTQLVAFLAAAMLVAFANLDTLDLTRTLMSNPQARSELLELAKKRSEEADAKLAPTDTAQPALGENALEVARKKTDAARHRLADAELAMETAVLPFGWKRAPEMKELPGKVAGLLVSIFAVSLGAPFWFDVLQRFMKVRSTGAKRNSTDR